MEVSSSRALGGGWGWGWGAVEAGRWRSVVAGPWVEGGGGELWRLAGGGQ